MPLPKTLASYTDIERVLSNLLRVGGGTLTFSTSQEAFKWTLRARYYRILLAKQHTVEATQMYASGTPYDEMVIRCPKGSCVVEVSFTPPGQPTEIIGPDGAPLTLVEPEVEDEGEEEMMDEATRLIRGLDL